ncbi:hypothetical protein SLE2022_206810 [Rubroshorea leprosula]
MKQSTSKVRRDTRKKNLSSRKFPNDELTDPSVSRCRRAVDPQGSSCTTDPKPTSIFDQIIISHQSRDFEGLEMEKFAVE